MTVPITNKRASALRCVLGTLALVTIVSLSDSRPEASVPWIAECGAVLTGHETYVLTEDVLDCDESAPAITVIGPATLRLNGHTVSCELELELEPDDEGQSVSIPKEGTIGIRLEGKEARLIGGGKPAKEEDGTPTNVVTGCEQGVVLNGEGEHRVQGVTVTKSSDGAFVVDSDENELIGNVVRQVLAWGDSDTLEGSGFLISGDKNELVGNVAADNDSDDEAGFTIEGNENRLEDNISKDNVGYGYHVLGDENVLRGNDALKNEQHGFVVAEDAEGNVLKHNKSFENGDEPSDGIFASGFHVEGSGNELEDNLASRNGLYGIHLLEGAADNKVSHNTASDSFGFVGVVPSVPPAEPSAIGSGGDLIDRNDDCGSNEWYKNIFGTRSQTCIR
jgi:parallel beta-helix repeat protein